MMSQKRTLKMSNRMSNMPNKKTIALVDQTRAGRNINILYSIFISSVETSNAFTLREHFSTEVF